MACLLQFTIMLYTLHSLPQTPTHYVLSSKHVGGFRMVAASVGCFKNKNEMNRVLDHFFAHEG